MPLPGRPLGRRQLPQSRLVAGRADSTVAAAHGAASRASLRRHRAHSRSPITKSSLTHPCMTTSRGEHVGQKPHLLPALDDSGGRGPRRPRPPDGDEPGPAGESEKARPPPECDAPAGEESALGTAEVERRRKAARWYRRGKEFPPGADGAAPARRGPWNAESCQRVHSSNPVTSNAKIHRISALRVLIAGGRPGAQPDRPPTNSRRSRIRVARRDRLVGRAVTRSAAHQRPSSPQRRLANRPRCWRRCWPAWQVQPEWE